MNKYHEHDSPKFNVTLLQGTKITTKNVWFLLVFLLAFTSLNVNAQSNPNIESQVPIRLGLLPHLSTQIMMKKYRPLITYLQEEMSRPVIAITAPNFKTYIERVENGDFDIYMTAPNMAAYHEKNNQHGRLVKFTQQLQGVIVVAQDSPYETLVDLKGKTIATPDAIAVITSLGEETLKENGINPEKDVHLKYTPSHNNALQSLAHDKADAAMLGYPAYKMITSRGKLNKPTRVLIKTRIIPHMMFMSPPSVSEEMQAKLQTAMLKFPQSQAGKQFFSGVPFKGIAVISDDDMSSLDGLLVFLEQRLDM